MVIALQNIILIGYRATGKSSVGHQLALDGNLTFVDLDDDIVTHAGMTVEQMVSQYGWDHFRDLERSTLLAVSQGTNQVIATGGGAVLHRDIWPEVRQNSLMVWLQADVATICRRLAADEKSDSQRPSLTGQDISAEVEAVLAERRPLYEASSDVRIDSTRPLPEISAEIIALWQGKMED